MTDEDKLMFNFGKLLGTAEVFLEECDKFKYSKSVDMSGLHGLSIRVPQGVKGKSWHDAHNALIAIIEEIKTSNKLFWAGLGKENDIH